MPDGPLLAIDLGTSSAKVGLVAPDGGLLGFARRTYPLLRGAQPGQTEQDPEQWWAAVQDGMATVLRKWGCDVLTSGSGEEMLAKLVGVRRLPDLTLTSMRWTGGVAAASRCFAVRCTRLRDSKRP